MSEFYFRLNNDLDASWEVSTSGYNIPYHKQYENVMLSDIHVDVFKEWLALTGTKRKKLFQKYSRLLESYCYTDDYTGPRLSINFQINEEEPVLLQPRAIPTVSLANMAPTPEIKSTGNKKGTTMYFEDDCDCCDNTTIVKRETFSPEKRYFLERIGSVSSSLRHKAYVTYNMEPVAGPTTLNELVQWIKDGKYTIKNNAGDKSLTSAAYAVYVHQNFSWGTATPDESGYEKACGAILDAEQAAQDTIIATNDPAAMKAAVDALAAQTF